MVFFDRKLPGASLLPFWTWIHFGHGFRVLLPKCLIIHLSPQSDSHSGLGTASFLFHVFTDTVSDKAWMPLPRGDAFELLPKCKSCSSFALLNGVMFMAQQIAILCHSLCDSLYLRKQMKRAAHYTFSPLLAPFWRFCCC